MMVDVCVPRYYAALDTLAQSSAKQAGPFAQFSSSSRSFPWPQIASTIHFSRNPISTVCRSPACSWCARCDGRPQSSTNRNSAMSLFCGLHSGTPTSSGGDTLTASRRTCKLMRISAHAIGSHLEISPTSPDCACALHVQPRAAGANERDGGEQAV